MQGTARRRVGIVVDAWRFRPFDSSSRVESSRVGTAQAKERKGERERAAQPCLVELMSWKGRDGMGDAIERHTLPNPIPSQPAMRDPDPNMTKRRKLSLPDRTAPPRIAHGRGAPRTCSRLAIPHPRPPSTNPRRSAAHRCGSLDLPCASGRSGGRNARRWKVVVGEG
jgi:hypothetical protein